jgi:hypothetical protein
MSLSKITNRPAPSHPPCPQVCWERVGAGPGSGWRFTGPANGSCRWDGERKQWTRCVPRGDKQ